MAMHDKARHSTTRTPVVTSTAAEAVLAICSLGLQFIAALFVSAVFVDVGTDDAWSATITLVVILSLVNGAWATLLIRIILGPTGAFRAQTVDGRRNARVIAIAGSIVAYLPLSYFWWLYVPISLINGRDFDALSVFGVAIALAAVALLGNVLRYLFSVSAEN